MRGAQYGTAADVDAPFGVFTKRISALALKKQKKIERNKQNHKVNRTLLLLLELFRIPCEREKI